MKSKVVFFVIFGVVVLGVVVALLINGNSSKKQGSESVNPPANTNLVDNAQTATTTTGQIKTYPDVDINALIASFPASNASAADKQAFNKKMVGIAVDTNTLDITACKAEPPVMLVHLNKPFTVQNHDTSERSITHTQFTLNVSANSSKDFTLSSVGEGAYGYKCGGQFSGFLLITQ